jgi:hypothetical protein
MQSTRVAIATAAHRSFRPLEMSTNSLHNSTADVGAHLVTFLYASDPVTEAVGAFDSE